MNDNSKLMELNILPQITKIQNIIKLWSTRKIIPFGSILLSKSILMSQLIYLLRVIPLLNKKISDDIQKSFTDFVWPGKHFIKKKTLYCSYEDGGLRLPNISLYDLFLKSSWISKLSFRSQWYETHLRNSAKPVMWQGNLNIKDMTN